MKKSRALVGIAVSAMLYVGNAQAARFIGCEGDFVWSVAETWMATRHLRPHEGPKSGERRIVMKVKDAQPGVFEDGTWLLGRTLVRVRDENGDIVYSLRTDISADTPADDQGNFNFGGRPPSNSLVSEYGATFSVAVAGSSTHPTCTDVFYAGYGDRRR